MLTSLSARFSALLSSRLTLGLKLSSQQALSSPAPCLIPALFRRLILISAIYSLSACSLFSQQPSDQTVADHQQYDWTQLRDRIDNIGAWELIGKIGIRTEEESHTAAINRWVQIGEIFSIDISSTFFGIGATNISGTSDFITLTESGEEPMQSEQPNELIEAALGLALPLTHLPYWIKALPIPEQSFGIHYNNAGLPAKIEQLGWEIQFSRYQEVNGLPLPHKIKLNSDHTRIILAIKQWTLI